MRTSWPSLVVVLAVGCGEKLPVFRDPPRDAGMTCTASGGGDMDGGADAARGHASGRCPEGQLCLSGRCFPRCESDEDCAIGERCTTEGACAPSTLPPADAGPRDASADGGIDAGACGTAMCEGTTPFCDPLSGRCVQCRSRDDCGGATPICEVAYGTCRAFTAARLCGPCNTDADCTGVGRCVGRDSPRERVCMRDCPDAGGCPRGFLCRSGLCTPIGSCTGFLAGLESRACASDAECVPIGASAASGQCTGSGGTMGICRIPCGTDMHCPDGWSCRGEFCSCEDRC
ncbi:MAG: hypothetical protein NZ898_09945 [Myxococcota bacterium]|nr:hypothetical protein [Myxococcota bacterium]